LRPNASSTTDPPAAGVEVVSAIPRLRSAAQRQVHQPSMMASQEPVPHQNPRHQKTRDGIHGGSDPGGSRPAISANVASGGHRAQNSAPAHVAVFSSIVEIGIRTMRLQIPQGEPHRDSQNLAAPDVFFDITSLRLHSPERSLRLSLAERSDQIPRRGMHRCACCQPPTLSM